MSDTNPLGFLPAGNHGYSGVCGDQGESYADLTPTAWLNGDSQTEDFYRIRTDDYYRPPGFIGTEDAGYLDLSRAVYEAAQNLEIVEDDCGEPDKCDEPKDHCGQPNHSELVKKMGNTLGFSCYTLKFANKEARNSYLPRSNADDEDEDRDRRAIRRPRRINANKGRSNKNYKRAGDSDSSSDSSTDSSTQPRGYSQKNNKGNHAKQIVRDAASSTNDFSVDDSELKTFADRRISEIRKDLFDGFDSDTSSEKSVDLDDLGKRAQQLLNLAGSKGRSLSMHNVYQAAKRS